MEVRFLIDSDTGLPHIDQHGVCRQRRSDVLRRPDFEGPGREETRIAEGQTSGGRYLRVVYKRSDPAESLFVITAYDLTGNALRAFRRRRRRRHT